MNEKEELLFYGSVDLMSGKPHNYCPNCDEKMVESQESEK